MEPDGTLHITYADGTTETTIPPIRQPGLPWPYRERSCTQTLMPYAAIALSTAMRLRDSLGNAASVLFNVVTAPG